MRRRQDSRTHVEGIREWLVPVVPPSLPPLTFMRRRLDLTFVEEEKETNVLHSPRFHL